MESFDVICRNVGIVTGAVPAPPAPPHSEHHHPRRNKSWLAVLWGVSGTVLSALGFVAYALFEQYNAGLNELQRDLKQFHQVAGELVKKESLQRCYSRLGDCIKELEASSAARGQLERELEHARRARQEMEREVQKLRERLAAVEGRQAATPVVVTVPVER